MAIYKLEDVLTLQRGYDLPYHKLKSGIYPVVQSNGISKYHSEYKINFSEGVITGRSGTIGEVHFVEGPFWPHNTTLYVSDFKGNSPKYIYYLLKQLDLKKFSTGTGVPTLNRNHLNYVTVYLPSLKVQREIIDIIAPVEDLFLKYSNLVRIDTVENCNKDVCDLIDIIAPIERCIHNVQKQINVLKKILVNQYKLNNEEPVSFADYITVCSFKYNGQKGYLATNAISEFSIEYSKLQNIEVTNRPSRANLTPEVNSLIISKLDGENKVYYIDESFPYVVSTGFFNFTTKYLDHITGFILSDSFKEQKSIFSTGTTMIGLNNDSLFKIKMVKPSSSSNTYTLKLNSLLKVEQELYSTLNILIKLLIK